MPEPRFVLSDFTCLTPRGVRLYEAGHSYPMFPALAHAAAKSDLVAHRKPPHWMPPSILVLPVAITAEEIAAAEGELQALEQHAAEAPMFLDARA
jgi:hypothetical protein